jgi:hypothetical protein
MTVERDKQPQPGPGKALPYAPRSARPVPTTNGYAVLTAPREPEPEIAQGIDLSGKPKVVFAAGAGNTGKTKLLRWISETSLAARHDHILADIDPNNASFSAYFEGVSRPETYDPVGVRRWLLDLISYIAAEKVSAVIDLGGGDTTLRSIADEVPRLFEDLQAEGIAPVLFYPVGRRPDDLAPALTLVSRGFVASAQAIVLNEFAIPTGMLREEAFSRLRASPAYAELAKSSVELWMPRNFAAEAIEIRHCGFRQALQGGCEPPLDFIDRSRLATWLTAMDRRFSGVRTWLP